MGKRLISLIIATAFIPSLRGQHATANRIQVYLDSAFFYSNKDDFPTALTHYQHALSLAEKQQDSIRLSIILHGIGSIYGRMNQLQRSATYLKKALTIAQLKQQPIVISDCYKSLGNIEEVNQRYTVALDYYFKSLHIQQALKDTLELIQVYSNIGVAYNDSQELEKAIHYFDKALLLAKRKENDASLAMLYVNQGFCYYDLNQQTTAIQSFQNGYYYAGMIHSPDYQQHALYGLSLSYKKLGKFEKALDYYQRHIALKDSIYGLRVNEHIAELEEKYQSQKKQIEIARLTIDRDKNKQLFQKSEAKIARQLEVILYISVILLLVGISTYFIFRQFRIKQRLNQYLTLKNEEVLLQKQQIEENLRYTEQLQGALKNDLNHYMQVALRKQMNPHFLFNSLNSIQSYILQNNKLAANQYLSKFAGLMRQVLENSSKEFISVKQEIAMITLYIELEQERFEQQFAFDLLIDQELNLAEYQIPSLLVQPYVENAIWHGLMHKDTDRRLTIRLNRNHEMLEFTIEDNGIGRKAAQKIRDQQLYHESLGIKITEDRVNLINSIHITNMQILTEDLYDNSGIPIGTCVHLYIPLISILKEPYKNESTDH